MTPDEAIKQNKQWIKEHPHLGVVGSYTALPPYDAIKLGIEALERLKQYRYSIIIALGERIRINETGQAIILVGEQGIDGLVFNAWWTAFRQKLSMELLPSETEEEK